MYVGPPSSSVLAILRLLSTYELSMKFFPSIVFATLPWIDIGLTTNQAESCAPPLPSSVLIVPLLYSSRILYIAMHLCVSVSVTGVSWRTVNKMYISYRFVSCMVKILGEKLMYLYQVLKASKHLTVKK